MIRHMRQMYSEKKIPPKPKKKSVNVQAILAPKVLLATPLKQEAIKLIRMHAHIPQEHYEALCTTLINSVANFSQKLPFYKKFQDEQLSQFLNVNLLRAANALKAYQEKEASITHFPRKHHHAKNALFTYALFSASLLLDTGTLFTHFAVTLCDDHGTLIKKWQPLKSMLHEEGSYYRVKPATTPDAILAKYLTPPIAKQLMPKNGLEWLSSDEDILKMWLAILNGESAYAGTLGHIISLADQKIAAILEKEERLDSQEIFELEESEDLSKADKAKEDFINWLEDKIKNNKDSQNVLITENSIAVTPEIIKSFNEVYPGHKNSLAVAFTNKHNMLGIAPLSGDDKVFAKYFGKEGKSKANIVVNPNLKQSLPNLATRKTTTSSVQITRPNSGQI